ncbi:hypothetical protein KYB31_20750 [Clostridium felsineum]|uniref:hypothetical protein n=1 Tax=Clostridium felsineum TaxID=36839 RepID=UPI00098CE14D|nr:hypothetical protein [Clostridium felsineum]MCR3761407.1 hypothetical protein [Clostridium felsineum]URZ01981.1 hypothetical protein CLAUR_019780 [Clostridium felsineum]
MRVYVKNNNIRFIIPVPNFLIRFSMNFLSKPSIIEKIPKENRKYVEMIDFKELYKCIDLIKEYKGLRIVEVKDKNGNEVSITL